MEKQTVTINGTVYDAHTGLPVSGSKVASEQAAVPPVKPRIHPSQAVHHATQKSQTLNRRVVQKMDVASPTQTRPTVTKSPAITKFAPHPVGAKPAARKFSDIGPVAHPVVEKVHQQIQQQTATQETSKRAPKPSQVIKQEAIAEAMEKAPARSHKEKPVKKHAKKLQRFMSIGSVSLALLLLAGYFTYLNLPSLSVRVAAAQAGVNASYPEYHPDGYSLSGAVAYSEGQVSMKFASNTGPQNYTINQSKSNWDSSAVGNDVDKKTDGKYITYNERGLTIYTYGSDAAWVNGGILYTIKGDAPLSSDQIRRIATSM